MDNDYRLEDILDHTSNTAHFLWTIFDNDKSYSSRKIENIFDIEILNSDLVYPHRDITTIQGENFLQYINEIMHYIIFYFLVESPLVLPVTIWFRSEDE